MSTYLRRVLSGLALLVVVGNTAHAADESAREFLAKLREEKMFDAAVKYLEGLRSKPDVDAETKALIPFELGSVLFEWSGTIKSDAERLDTLARAEKHLREFIKEQPAHVQVRPARLLLGQVGTERGKTLGRQAAAAGEAEARRKLIAQAEDEFKAARTTLAALLKDLDAELAKFPAFAAAGEVRRQKNKARRDVIEVSIHLADVSYRQAQLFERGSKRHAELLTEAAGVFHTVRDRFRSTVAGLYAGVWEARCHQEMGALKEALAIYVEALDADASDDSLRDLQTRALRLAMECWSDPQQNQWRQIVDRGQAWLEATPADAQETSDGWAIVFSLAKAQHAILEADKTRDPAEKMRKLSAEERKAMTESAIGHLRRVAASKSELANDAIELLRRYEGKK